MNMIKDYLKIKKEVAIMPFELKSYHKKISKDEYISKLESGAKNVRFIDNIYFETDMNHPDYKTVVRQRNKKKSLRLSQIKMPLKKMIKKLKDENKVLKIQVKKLSDPDSLKREQIKKLRAEIKAWKGK